MKERMNEWINEWMNYSEKIECLCSGLIRFGLHRLMYLNAWPTGSDIFRKWVLVRTGVSLLGEMRHRGLWGTLVLKLHPGWTRASSWGAAYGGQSLLAAFRSRCRASVLLAPCLPAHCRASRHDDKEPNLWNCKSAPITCNGQGHGVSSQQWKSN